MPDNGTKIIELTQGEAVTVDAADYKRLSQYKWAVTFTQQEVYGKTANAPRSECTEKS